MPITTPLTVARPRYTAFLRYTHWITFVLVLLAYITINARKYLERGSPGRVFVVNSHYLLGILVLLITLPRIIDRLRNKAPPIAPPMGRASRIASGSAHIALFIFLIVQPILGIATRMLSGRGIGMPLLEWTIPSIGPVNAPLARSIEHLHETIGIAFYYVIGIHILAALWHWLFRRDDVLQRMT